MSSTTSVDGCPFSTPTDFTPWHPDYVAHPYPTWEWLRREAPVFYAPEADYWVIAHHEPIRQILLDSERISAHTMPIKPTPWPDDVQERLDQVIPRRPVLSNLDGEEHDNARRFLRFAFTPRRLEWMRPHVEGIVDSCLDDLIGDDGRGDLVASFTEIVPLLTLMRFLGFPDHMLPKTKVWSHTREYLFQGQVTEEEIRSGVEPMVEYYTYARQRVQELEEDPGDDYMSELIQMWKREQPADVDHEDLINILITLMSAGHKTTADLSANGLRGLLLHRDQWDAVCEDPSLVPAAVDEMIRWDTAVPSWRRVVVKDIEVDGHTIPAGSKLLMFLGSANRDEHKVANGEEFDIFRDDGRQYLSFGVGRHYCLGQPLAKQELTVMVERITARFPDLRLVEGHMPSYRLNIIHRGPDSLPVELASAASKA